jgi:hypothetical protein
MVKTQFISRLAPWLLPVLLSAAGMFLGYEWGSVTAGLLGGEPGIWARLGKGFIWGLLIAGLQWPIIRSVGVLPVWFLVASSVSFAIGYPLGQTIQAIMVIHWSSHWMWGYGSALATFGLFLGLPQWWILRQHLQRAGFWILCSVIGWILTGVAWINFGANSGVDALVYGVVTGLGLVWLAHSREPKVKNQST